MTTVWETEGAQCTALAKMSPLILGAVVMPWLLERAIIRSVFLVAPAYRSVVTDGILDVVLYPVITGSIVLVGLYILLDPATRRSVFPTDLPSRPTLLVIPIVGVVTATIGFLVTGVVIAALGSGEGGSTAGMTGPIDASFVFWFLVTGAVFAPLVEETLFRGLLLGFLLERVSVPVAGGLVAISFGLVHLYAGPARVISAAVVGGILVVVRLRYESLVVPIGVHALHNVLTLVAIVMLLGS